MTQSLFRNFILGSMFGFAIALFIASFQARGVLAAPSEAQKPCAQVIMGGKNYGIVSQQGWDAAQSAIHMQHVTIERLNDELKKARAIGDYWQKAASIENRNSAAIAGFYKDCMDGNAPGGAVTVLYESGRASLNVSLLPLPGAPRIALSPNSQLAPRWIIPGRIQPQMVGETRKAIYYYFEAQSSQWQGPFAPQRVVQ